VVESRLCWEGAREGAEPREADSIAVPKGHKILRGLRKLDPKPLFARIE
jgi:hypothetical protein